MLVGVAQLLTVQARLDAWQICGRKTAADIGSQHRERPCHGVHLVVALRLTPTNSNASIARQSRAAMNEQIADNHEAQNADHKADNGDDCP